MTNCANCGSSVLNGPLIRVNEKGVKGIFWCEECVKTKEPELYKNETEDGVLNDLKNICYEPSLGNQAEKSTIS